MLRLDREMNEWKGGGEDETAAAGDDDAEDASDGARAEDGKVSRGAFVDSPALARQGHARWTDGYD